MKTVFRLSAVLSPSSSSGHARTQVSINTANLSKIPEMRVTNVDGQHCFASSHLDEQMDLLVGLVSQTRYRLATTRRGPTKNCRWTGPTTGSVAMQSLCFSFVSRIPEIPRRLLRCCRLSCVHSHAPYSLEEVLRSPPMTVCNRTPKQLLLGTIFLSCSESRLCSRHINNEIRIQFHTTSWHWILGWMGGFLWRNATRELRAMRQPRKQRMAVCEHLDA